MIIIVIPWLLWLLECRGEEVSVDNHSLDPSHLLLQGDQGIKVIKRWDLASRRKMCIIFSMDPASSG